MKFDISKFEEWAYLNKKSELTVLSYSYKIKSYFKEFDELNIKNIMDYLNKKKKTLKPSTINVIIEALKCYSEFLGVDIKFPRGMKPIQKLPKYITLKQLKEKILPAVDIIFQNPIKVKALFLFIFYTGCRREEIATLKRKNIDLKEKTAKIIGKGGKERIVFFPNFVHAYLKLYFATEQETISAFNLSNSGISRLFSEVRIQANLEEFYPHLLRHSFAIHLLSNNIGIEKISKIMGHVSIATTQRYLQISNEEVKNDYMKKIK